MENNMKAILEACLKCATECNRCYGECLKNNTGGNKHNCITTCKDCADICLLTASLVARNSKYANDLIAVCSKVCKECSETCKQSCEGENSCSVECLTCANTCAECAEICKQ